IRTPVGQVRIASRNTQGVIIFRTSEDEHVVSVERLADTGEDEADDTAGDDATGEGAAPGDEAPPET
ncbi:MAG: DNA gyrase C-terminal beta-propeller domain-containing protein, partial [Phenylobacterium sp.]